MRALTAVIAGILLGLPSVPYAIAIGLHDGWAILFTCLGMVLGMTGVSFLSDRLVARSKAKAAARGRRSKFESFARRAKPIVNKGGAAGLGILGTLVFGTSSSAVIGSVLGIPRIKLIPWLAVGVLIWATGLTFGVEALLDLFRSSN